MTEEQKAAWKEVQDATARLNVLNTEAVVKSARAFRNTHWRYVHPWLVAASPEAITAAREALEAKEAAEPFTFFAHYGALLYSGRGGPPYFYVVWFGAMLVVIAFVVGVVFGSLVST